MSNRLILAGIATEILIIPLIVYTPWRHALFGTASIALAVWLFIIPFALGMLALEELRKWFVPAPTHVQPPLPKSQLRRFCLKFDCGEETPAAPKRPRHSSSTRNRVRVVGRRAPDTGRVVRPVRRYCPGTHVSGRYGRES